MNPLAQLQTALSDRYTIERELGAGGMATVYLAHDLRHQRKVALKVMRPELAAVIGAERFLAEITTTANLQHPHILALFDSGAVDGTVFYVMPFIDGESLRMRLDRERQLPIDDAVRIAREVADALQYAHERGVIHRDIKPENILLHGGHALVSDFGIALAAARTGGSRMTETGMSLGTPTYMSPEQAMGDRTVDARTDIYALGCVLYEMLAGQPPHTGATAQAIVAKVITEPPASIVKQRPRVPPHVEAAALTALEKLPADRFATASEFTAALMGHAVPLAPQSMRRVQPARWRDPLALALGAVILVLAGVAAMLAAPRNNSSDPFPVRTVITPDAEGPIGPGVLSRDGQSVVYLGAASSGNGRAYYIRRLDQLASREIAGTDRANRSPVFSPDGKWIAFIQGRRRLVKVPLEGGAPVTLAAVADYGGHDWAPNGEIILGPGVDEGRQGLLRVSDAGGSPVPLTHVDTARKELSHQSPRILDDGRTILFTIWMGSGDNAELAVTSLDDGKVVPLGVLGATPLGVVDGQLVYLNADGLIMAVPFDQRRKRTSGTPRLVQAGVRFMGGGGSDHDEASMTDDGGLVYIRGNAKHRLVWVDRSGRQSAALDTAREYAHVRLAPNGRQAAVTIVTGARRDIWTLDLTAGTLTPLTTTGTSRNPIWSADGQRILYASTHGGRAAFWWQPADGSGAAQLAVTPRHNPWFADLSPDGRHVVFNAIASVNFDLESVSLDSTHEARELSASRTAIEAQGRFSPDGRWVAYNSDESGAVEVYVRPFGQGGGRTLVSVAGGLRPIWGHDGRKLYYWEGTRLIEATLSFDPVPAVVSRTTLFSGRYENDFDVSRDGTRFLMIALETSGLGLVVIPNFRTELKRLTTGRQ